jgi:hypothetical protein
VIPTNNTSPSTHKIYSTIYLPEGEEPHWRVLTLTGEKSDDATFNLTRTVGRQTFPTQVHAELVAKLTAHKSERIFIHHQAEGVGPFISVYRDKNNRYLATKTTLIKVPEHYQAQLTPLLRDEVLHTSFEKAAVVASIEATTRKLPIALNFFIPKEKKEKKTLSPLIPLKGIEEDLEVNY